jgi:hypothetical protein
VEVENVSRIGFSPGRAPEKQGKLPVGRGMLGKIVVDNQCVLAIVPEVLTHGAPCERSKEKQGGGVACRCADDDGVFQGPVLLEVTDHPGNSGFLLADSDIDADDRIIRVLLIDDRVDGHGRFTGLAVADDELPLTTPDGDHGVNGFNACLEGLFNGLPLDDTGSDDLHQARIFRFDGALTVDGLAEGVDHPAKHPRTHGHFDDTSRALYDIAFLDELVLTQKNDTHVVFLEVEDHAEDLARQLHELTSHGVLEAVHTGDPVTGGQDNACFLNIDGLFESFDLLLYYLGYLFSSNLHRDLSPLAEIVLYLC